MLIPSRQLNKIVHSCWNKITQPKASKLVAMLVATFLLSISLWHLMIQLEWQEAMANVRNSNFGLLITALLLIHFGYICVRTWRWREVLDWHAKPNASLVKLYWISAIVNSLAIITPGQAGEILKVELLKRESLLERLPGLGGVLVERLLDYLAVTGLVCIGLVLDFGLVERFRGIAMLAVLIIMPALLIFYCLVRSTPIAPNWHWLEVMRTGTGSPKRWLKIAAATILTWGLIGLSWQVCLLAIGLHLPYHRVLWLVGLITIGSLLSFIPGGIGVADYLAVTSLINLGIPVASAQAGALIIRAYTLTVLAFGLIHLLFWFLYKTWIRSSLASNL